MNPRLQRQVPGLTTVAAYLNHAGAERWCFTSNPALAVTLRTNATPICKSEHFCSHTKTAGFML
jgi:hypothetical protein